MCSAKKKHEHVMLNVLIGSAKLPIWLTCKNKDCGAGYFETVLVLKGLLRTRLKMKYGFFLQNDTLILLELHGKMYFHFVLMMVSQTQISNRKCHSGLKYRER